MTVGQTVRCDQCVFYASLDDLPKPWLSKPGARGECRRDPPKIVPGYDQEDRWRRGWWPIVQADDWCGHHQAMGAGTIQEMR
jgi:hypothetical protein